MGEFPAQDRDVATIEPLPMQTLDRPSLLDSDENNNDSQRSSSISEVVNQVTFHPIGSPKNSSKIRATDLGFKPFLFENVDLGHKCYHGNSKKSLGTI